MNDHLDAINGNTNEINSFHEYLTQFENMITKLGERLDSVELKIAEIGGNKSDFKNIILNAKEQEIFLMLYSRTGDLMDYREISRSLGVTEELVRKHISGMINKGIPIIKKYFEGKTYLILDADFRNLQAKENILKL